MSNRKWNLRLSPAIVIASIALFAAMSGVGVAALKLAPNSVRTKNIKNNAVTESKLAHRAVTQGKLGVGAVTTGKFAPGATAPNAAMLAGVAPGGCQTGWVKASLVVDTTGLPLNTPTNEPGFNCASHADDAVQITHTSVGHYTVQFANNDAGIAVASGAGGNDVVNAVKAGDGQFTVKVWKNVDGTFVDDQALLMVAF